MEQAPNIKWQEWLTVGLCCFLITIPTFFEIYRTLVFGTIPYDSYQTIIQYYNGEVPYSEMWSPTFYRFAYNYLSFFFSKTLPILRFSKSDTTDAHLAIFQGLAVTSYLFHFLFGLLAYYFLKVSKRFSTLVAAMVSIIALQHESSRIFGVTHVILAPYPAIFQFCWPNFVFFIFFPLFFLPWALFFWVTFLLKVFKVIRLA